MSRIARAWISERVNRTWRVWNATSADADSRIVWITASRLSSAIFKPSKMWARARAFSSSKRVLRVSTSWR